MKKLLTACLLFFSVTSVFAYEIVELYYRDAREIVSGVQGMLQPGESASVIDNKIRGCSRTASNSTPNPQYF